MRGLTRSLVPAVAVATVLVAGPAYGFGPGEAPGGGSGGGSGTVPPSSTGDSSGSGGGEGMVDNCHVVANSSYLGLSCYDGEGGGGGERRTVKQILGDDELPGCWHEAMDEQERAALSLENTESSTWYWERCLEGIDPETLKIGPEGVDVSVGYVALHTGDVVSLTDKQQDLIDTFRLAGDAVIPAPVAGVSPAARPRVGAWVSFFNGTRSEVTATAGAMVLRASVSRIDVEPLGAGRAPLLSCSGNGYQAERGDGPDTVPDACWHKYEHSSAGEPGQKYPVRMTTHWTVEYSRGGGWQPFVGSGSSPVTFTKSQVTNHPVTEIQALVIR